MSKMLVKYVTTRPDLNAVFRDTTGLNEFNNEYHALKVDWEMYFTDGGLTRTLVMFYDEPLHGEILWLMDKYADAHAAERARKEAIGIKTVVTEQIVPDNYEMQWHIPNGTGNKVVKYMSMRFTRDVLFNDSVIVSEFNNAHHDLPINVRINYDEGMLTRVRITEYDRELDKTLSALREQHAEALAIEGKRQWDNDIRTSIIDVTNEPAFIMNQLGLTIEQASVL